MDVLSVIYVVVGFIVGMILPLIFAKYLPNEKFYKWGVKHGKYLTKKGREWFGVENWEKVENSITGSAVAYVQGVSDGADSDD